METTSTISFGALLRGHEIWKIKQAAIELGEQAAQAKVQGFITQDEYDARISFILTDTRKKITALYTASF